MANVSSIVSEEISKLTLELSGEEAAALLRLTGSGCGGITTGIFSALSKYKSKLPKVAYCAMNGSSDSVNFLPSYRIDRA